MSDSSAPVKSEGLPFIGSEMGFPNLRKKRLAVCMAFHAFCYH